jgi:diacylglycerol kinase (ATP)
VGVPYEGPDRVRAVLVINPRSGHGSGRAVAASVALALGAFWEVRCVETSGPGDATRLAREAASEPADLVLACGGDGTLSQCVSGLMGSGVPCGLIPCGTGNDFARTAGIPLGPERAAEYALRAGPRAVDLLSVNKGAHLCLNVSGSGLDAAIAERMNRRNRVTGGLAAYIPAIVAEIMSPRRLRGTLCVDQEVEEGEWTLVAFANARSYGAGMLIAPDALVDDGLMDVVAIGALPKMELLRQLPLLRTGKHIGHPAVRCWKARTATLTTHPDAPVLVDGDLACRTPVSFEVLPGAALLWLAGAP